MSGDTFNIAVQGHGFCIKIYHKVYNKFPIGSQFVSKPFIINKGSLLFQGTLGELREIGVSTVYIETNELEKGLKILIDNNFPMAKLNKANLIETDIESKEEINKITRLMVKNDIPVSGISNSKKDLEQLFLDITKAN